MDYDPVLPKVSIEPFIDTPNAEQGQEELKTVHMKEFYACPNCGRPILPEKESYFVCPNCGRALCKAEDLNDFSDKFCGNCGCDLSSAKEILTLDSKDD